jgi:WD40 repeat protein
MPIWPSRPAHCPRHGRLLRCEECRQEMDEAARASAGSRTASTPLTIPTLRRSLSTARSARRGNLTSGNLNQPSGPGKENNMRARASRTGGRGSGGTSFISRPVMRRCVSTTSRSRLARWWTAAGASLRGNERRVQPGWQDARVGRLGWPRAPLGCEQHRPKGRPLRGHAYGQVWAVAYSPDGQTLVCAGQDGTVRLWDPIADRARGDPLRGHTDRVPTVAFSQRTAPRVSWQRPHDQVVEHDDPSGPRSTADRAHGHDLGRRVQP